MLQIHEIGQHARRLYVDFDEERGFSVLIGRRNDYQFIVVGRDEVPELIKELQNFLNESRP